jgi:hypothetical protein
MAKARRKSAVAKALLGAQAEGVPFKISTLNLPRAENAVEAYWDTLPGRIFYNVSRADGFPLLNMLRDLVHPGTGKFGKSELSVRLNGASNLGDVVLAATGAVRLRQPPAHLFDVTKDGKKLVLRLLTPHGIFDVLCWLDIRSDKRGNVKVSVRFQLAHPPT